MTEPDPYRLLGVARTADATEIKAAWHARLQECHPDRAQTDGPDAVARAEARTKAVNAAYTRIKEGDVPRPTRGRTSGGHRTATRVRPARAPRPANAREALRRAQVAIQYADTLCGHWRRHAATIRQARRAAGEAAETATEAARRSALVRLETVGGRDVLVASLDAAADEIARTEDVATQMSERMGPLFDSARRMAHSAERATRGIDREARVASTAAKRGRDAQQRARRAIQGLSRAVANAGRAVDRASVAAGLAAGISAADLASADDEQAQFLAERAVEEGKRYQFAAAKLVREQARVVEAVGLVPERTAEIRAMVAAADDGARRARENADVARAAVAELEALAGRVASEVVARIEARAEA